MSDIKKIPESAMEYFNSLPKMIQEQIMQSGVTINGKEDIERIYNNIVSE